MRMSKMFMQTLRDYPADAEVISHKLLVRAGFIKKLANGVYNYLPLMWRVLKKIENIVREEMDAAGAQELLMPFVQPEELWQESGRWNVYGKELMRMKDRHDKSMCLGPTHEEVITFIARECVQSYKQLPLNLYQIQSKFRDEIRPRFGLLRGREFIMKDAYSFDTSYENLEKSYKIMADTYTRIFDRCGLETKAVQSDSGAIGGNVSHEYMVLTDTDSGENDVFYCDNCDFAANSNHTTSVLPPANIVGNFAKMEEVSTPNTKTIDEVANFLNIEKTVIVKSLVYVADSKTYLVLIRGDRNVEEIKLQNAIGANEIRIACEEEIEELMTNNNFSGKAGFIGPVGMKNVEIIADLTTKEMKNFVVGANKNDTHIVGANWSDISANVKFADICLAQAGDFCPQCGAPLKVTRGIEVGNIFQLGTKYSEKMKATYTDENGVEKPFIMGCYGIGISRTAAAAVERFHDENGIKWPVPIAPYHVDIVPVNIGDELQMKVAEEIYQACLNHNIEAVLDDRDLRAGVKFKDADLIGFPYKIVVGKGIVNGLVEFKNRMTGEAIDIKPDEVLNYVKIN